ncbi:zinc finger protein draculin-like isoform X14 [Onthophagus taurus]|uniref:zinc finger protein draculin-like isoform X14 n=1 Tax=Onthophagus taurus TaxID=166361 RepID=UPI000C20A870|nr:zinc finger protein 2-like isoform X10 [Onthophagus taurus]
MMGTMSSIKEIMQFCRLCLVKDQVNVSIFEEHGDTRDVKRKISECLPVTVSEEDSLPKKICDGCLYKLELLYQFRTTCVSAEKQLQVWIAELNNSESKEDQDLKLQHSQTSVKEEIFDATDHPDNSEYVIEEQHISYEEGDIPYNESQDDNDDGDATNSSDDEPLAKRRKRFLEEQVQTDDTLKTADNKMAITKLEHESDDENVDDPEPNFVSVGTSDDQQPGPSGLNKMSATTTNAEMPCTKSKLPEDITCPVCDKVFINRLKLNQHCRQHKPKSFCCQLCGKSYKKNYELQLHKERHFKKKTIPCGVCGKMLSSDITLKKHMIACHLKEHPFKCDQCDKGYLSEAALDNHKKTAHDGVVYKCDQCEKIYKWPQAYKNHVKTHETGYIKPEHVCMICSKILGSKSSLQDHLRTHQSIKRYMCEICGKGVTSLESLKIHERGHRGEKPFACKHCPKKFVSNALLRPHERIHTNEKPYVCQTCNKAFNQYGSYKIHTRIHTGERPYGCHLCEKRFPSRTALNTHLKKH